MPRGSRATKPRGKGGLLVGIIILVVILVGLGVAGHFWNRSSAMSTAEQYVEAAMGLFKTGKPDAAILKSILAKDQAAQVDQEQGLLFDIANGPFGPFLTLAKASYKMGEAKIGMSEATVNATITAQAMQRSFPLTVKIGLVREGLSWKVDEKKTQIVTVGAGGPKP